MGSTAFDWEKVKNELQASIEGLTTVKEDPRRIERVYQERAERYAKRDLEKKRESTERWLMVPFLEGSMAVPLALVSDVLKASILTDVPGSPPELIGFISFQGEIVPILDPWVLVGKARPQTKDQGFFLLIKRGLDRVGISVPRIEALTTIPKFTQSAWGQCPELNTYFRAWGADGIILLDAVALAEGYL